MFTYDMLLLTCSELFIPSRGSPCMSAALQAPWFLCVSSIHIIVQTLQEQWWILCCKRVEENKNDLSVISKELADEFLKYEKVSPFVNYSSYIYFSPSRLGCVGNKMMQD